MRMKGNRRGLSRLICLLLALCLMSGLCVQAAADDESGGGTSTQADKNILAYALREAKKVDTKLLDNLISTAPNDVKKLRTRFEEAVDDAEKVYANPAADNTAIQAAYDAIQTVMWELSYVKADLSKLQAAIDEANDLKLKGLDDKPEASVTAFNKALTAAEKLLEELKDQADLSMTEKQGDIDIATQDLKAAIEALTKKPTTDTPGSNNNSSSDTSPTPSEEPGKTDEKPTITYTDVPDNAWYAEGVEYVSRMGIMNGTGNGQFSPQATTSRAMIWTMLYRLAGEPEQSGGGESWYGKAMLWAQQTGMSDGSNPSSAITREQLAVMLYRYAGSMKTDFDLSAYSDRAEISDWAQEGMMWAVETGLINGKGDGILDPKGTATRAETATIFMRYMQKLNGQ